MLSLWLRTGACILAAGLPAHASQAAQSAAGPAVQAERAFAARHKEVSVKEAFLEHSAADGFALEPGGVKNVREALAGWPDGGAPGVIDWWPEFAGLARSGDLGFTTGPAVYQGGKASGYYFTIWKRQPDGNFRWVIDFGTRPSPLAAPHPQPKPVEEAPASDLDPGDPNQAWTDLLALDARLGEALKTDRFAAVSRLAANGRVMGLFRGLAVGEAQAREALAARPAGMGTKPEGGGISEAGDLGWTFGYVDWSGPEKPKPAGYVRVWQKRAAGWTLLVENVSPL